MGKITLEVEGVVSQPPDWIAMTRDIAEIALRINERLIAENADLKQQLASRPPSRNGPPRRPQGAPPP